ncbi:hypothetical protein KY321_02915 [Candidatus Woesearchaeota archaeon]|nr:hypothetical protein [Candidatus Woesearchaeota archaeon]
MESPLKKYKTLSDINDIKNKAYYTLFTKYIIENRKGEGKILELGDTDQESLMRKMNGGFPIPGFVYTFIYPPGQGEVIIQNKNEIKKYDDYVPIVFCTSVQKDSFKGLNFNVLPELERVKFLEIYYNSYEKFFKDLEYETENDKLAINKKYVNLASSKRGQEIIQHFSKITGANFNFGYRTYNLRKIKQLRMVEYTEWDYIPFYNPREAFKQMNQKQIHDLYWKTR